MMPVGPRFAQPETYRPAPEASVGSTRPFCWGTRRRSLSGKPSSGVKSKPTLLSTRPHSMSSLAPEEDLTAAWLPGAPCSSVRSSRMPPTLAPSAPGRTADGDKRKRSQIMRFEVDSLCAKFAAIFCRMSSERFFMRLPASSSLLAGFWQSASSSGSTMGRTSSLIVRSSRSSAFVKAAWTKPRLPTRCTVCKPCLCHSPI
mmetsp:Transcript_47904/g.138596  ORF Transcript_47904/g.138596 Transcript_47904/m.138596 type:complete len:201 (-) Transcript_47904:764-1366(-)